MNIWVIWYSGWNVSSNCGLQWSDVKSFNMNEMIHVSERIPNFSDNANLKVNMWNSDVNVKSHRSWHAYAYKYSRVCVCVCVLHFPHCLLYYCCCASSIQFFLGTVSSKKYLSLFVPGPGAMYSSQSGVQSGLVYSPQAPQSYSLDSQLGMTGMGWWFVLQIMF